MQSLIHNKLRGTLPDSVFEVLGTTLVVLNLQGAALTSAALSLPAQQGPTDVCPLRGAALRHERLPRVTQTPGRHRMCTYCLPAASLACTAGAPTSIVQPLQCVLTRQVKGVPLTCLQGIH